MKNRIICLLLAVIMCLACLAGCMGGGDSTGGDDTSTDDTADKGNTDTGNKDDTTTDDTNKDDENDDANTDDEDDENEDDENEDDENEDDDDLYGDEGQENEWWKDITYNPTTLIFRMTNCSNRQELPSGCERYLAGEDKSAVDTIDDKVRARNENAKKNTKVDVKYMYYPDTFDLYGYSLAQNEIIKEINTASKENRPDIFCNWMTDMLLCSLKGKFANVMTAEQQYGKNYFDIRMTEDNEGDQYGYMSELMRSLTLNKGQVYVIASDYFIDLIRAFFVVPVNTTLFNQVVQSGKVNPAIQDYTEDGTLDINDLFYEVEAGKWTYDRLIQYSAAVYERKGNAESANDVLGFALGANGLPAAGMIYTSSVTVIQSQKVGDTWKYTYPDSNAELSQLMTKISEMMDVDGILCMTKQDAANLQLQGEEQTALLGIRHKFTTNSLLFGGVILVGSLEYDAYQNMKNQGGFGVLPVPVYKAGDKYLTQIHVVGRAGGITASTEKFSACSAFIQYQTQNSIEILDYYYKYNLTYGTASGLSGNVRMLNYIRNNVRTSFDKLFEDAIGFFFDNGISEDDRYHTLLANASYKFDNFETLYEKNLALKQKNLAALEEEYSKLPK